MSDNNNEKQDVNEKKKKISEVFGILGPVSDEVKETLKDKTFEQIREESREERIKEYILEEKNYIDYLVVKIKETVNHTR